ncbi:unnamed protein product [Lactuca virosa]|uniref:Uncharacterized protein n=1 Tax=Lactuca virosa TaxID=75947 RepID=A0AAU9N8T7_9ASTR|nr:unnamed protein product [Lactuca virosa]
MEIIVFLSTRVGHRAWSVTVSHVYPFSLRFPSAHIAKSATSFLNSPLLLRTVISFQKRPRIGGKINPLYAVAAPVIASLIVGDVRGMVEEVFYNVVVATDVRNRRWGSPFGEAKTATLNEIGDFFSASADFEQFYTQLLLLAIADKESIPGRSCICIS